MNGKVSSDRFIVKPVCENGMHAHTFQAIDSNDPRMYMMILC